MNGYSYLTGPWAEWEGRVDELLGKLRHARHAEKIAARDVMTGHLPTAQGLVRDGDPVRCFSTVMGGN